MDNRRKVSQTWAALATVLGGVPPIQPGRGGNKSRPATEVGTGMDVPSRRVRAGQQESIFEESRGETFRALLAAELDDVRSAVRPAGLRSGHPIYKGGATRKQVRSLARRSARLAMREFRNKQREERGIQAV